MATLKGGSRFPPLFCISTLWWYFQKRVDTTTYYRNFKPPLLVEMSTLIIPPFRVEIVNHLLGCKMPPY